jgi:alginate O-acetyltransferase complex protein AlgI
MNFNSLVFVIFFVAVYLLYLLIRRQHRSQNVLLLVASYVFYAGWDWRFTGLLLVSTLTDYTIGRTLGRSDSVSTRKRLLIASVAVNLTVLGFFKYFNFFADSFVSTLGLVGLEPSVFTLKIILPVGISFYTFQTLAYSIDVYRRRIEPEHNLINYGLYVAFFPQLVAGPIERAGRLLPQIKRPRRITSDQINTGVFLIVWGLFKKVVIADQLAITADRVFSGQAQGGALTIAAGALAFAFQIYCDFSGYTDIARGVSKLLGFELMLNFRLPYFAKNPSDFWSRWHISLSTWIRDYLYIPLGGNRKGATKTILFLMIAMTLGGLWHGAAWNFVIWGAYHGALLVVYRMLSAWNRTPVITEPGGTFRSLFQISLMFTFVVFGWVIFRADSLSQISNMLERLVDPNWRVSELGILARFVYVIPLLALQAFQYRTGDLNIVLTLKPVYIGMLYASLILGMLMFAITDASAFIYFQF